MPPDNDHRFSPRPNRAHEIAWRGWSDSAFEEARATGKPLLLALSAVWCHWCHVMDETTYSNADVISTVNEKFVPVRVDSDRHPDINRRYNMGGWPTTVFLASSGAVLTGATYVPPHAMLDTLRAVSSLYEARRAEQASSLSAEDVPPHEPASPDAAAAAEAAPSTESQREADRPAWSGAVDWLVARAIDAFDPLHGGFGTQPKFPQADLLALLLLRAATCSDQRVDDVLRVTLDHMAAGRIYDSVEDGFFRYATQSDWSEPHYEKMLEDNARLLSVYAEAGKVYGEARYSAVADGMSHYLLGTLWQPDVQAFSGSQDADEEYYARDMNGRQELDPPFVDRTVFADWNALAASGLLRAARLLAQPLLAAPALAAIDTVWERGRTPHGVAHYLLADGPGPEHIAPGPVGGLLSDQALMTAALLDAYEYTGERVYLARAEVLADWVGKHLGLPDGGLADRLLVDGDRGLLIQPAPDISGCAAMADALLRLAVLTGEPRHRERAASLLASLTATYQHHGLGAAPLGAALLRLEEPQVHIVVVGRPELPDTRALHWAALEVPHPLSSVQVLDPVSDLERLVRDGFVTDAPPSAYVCLGTTCLPPTTEPAEIAGLAAGDKTRTAPPAAPASRGHAKDGRQ